MRKKIYLPSYGLGSWIKDNTRGVVGGLKTIAGGVLTATGVGAPLGVGLMASGVSDIAGEISSDRQAKEQEGLITQQEDFFNKNIKANQRLSELQSQPQMQFKIGGYIPTYAYGGSTIGLPQGKATIKDVEKFQKLYPKEMAMGRTVEYEHTKNKHLADRISADHIKDYLEKENSPAYYTKLKKTGLTDELANGGNLQKETLNKPEMTYYAEGGTHESNPNGGIKIGEKGKVEEGEFRYGDYIFSNRF